MANLAETVTWEAGIYQLEEEDLVQGGPDGIDNVQGKQLANRTAYLKQQVELALGDMAGHLSAADPHTQYATELWVAAQVAALVNAAPGALDTLKELASALGNDANFATTVTNALALKAPLASPALTGSPTAPTPAQFDAYASIATTEFVQRALGNYQNYYVAASNAVIPASHAGFHIYVRGNTAPVTLTLPAGSQLSAGAKFSISNLSSRLVTVALNAADGANLAKDAQGYVSSVVLPAETSVDFVYLNGNRWNAVGTGLLPVSSGLFGASIALSGYQKLPSGLIIQWGAVSTSSFADVTATFPIAFPNACLRVLTNSDDTGANFSTSNTYTTTTAKISKWVSTTGARFAGSATYLAIGF